MKNGEVRGRIVGRRRAGFLSIWVLLLCSALELQAETLYVASNGSDSSGDGSSSSPWATITHAIDSASDGDEIVVRPGTYYGRQRLGRQFASLVTVRSEIPYAAKLRHDRGAALVSFYGRNIVVEGFDIAHTPDNAEALVIQIQDLLGEDNGSDNGTDAVVSGIVLRNNIIHSSTNNDLLKINNGAENIVVEGNLFFNQSGSDEHIDINSVIGVVVRDNVFFNTAARPGTSSFIVVKDSNGTSDTVLGTRDVEIRRNVFLNWYGNGGQSFVRLGEDGTSNFEARGVLVENNLMIGNSPDLMRTPFTVQGSREITFRNNTVVGDLPSRSFAARLIAGTSNPANRDLVLTNNVWSDPTGSMGAEAYSGVDLFDAPPGDTASAVLDTNLYFNGGNTIPPDPTQFLTVADDANAVVADPMLPPAGDAVVPHWDGTNFADGSSSIRQAFRRLVFAHAVPAPGSPLIDAGDPGSSAVDDILGRLRDGTPDLGAFETGADTGPLFADGFESASR